MVREEDMEARRIVDQDRVVKNFPPSYDVPQLYFVFSQKMFKCGVLWCSPRFDIGVTRQ